MNEGLSEHGEPFSRASPIKAVKADTKKSSSRIAKLHGVGGSISGAPLFLSLFVDGACRQSTLLGILDSSLAAGARSVEARTRRSEEPLSGWP